MNRNQKIVGIICTLALVAMLIYPPFATYRGPGVKFGKGYSFIWNPPSGSSKEIIQKSSPSDGKTFLTKKPKIPVVMKKPGDKASIDVTTLLIQYLIIIIVRVLALYSLKDSEK